MAETFDLVITGAELMTPSGRGTGDVGVRGGKIAAIGDINHAQGGQLFDGRGLTVLPGLIDTQVHFREPGMEWKAARRLIERSTASIPASSGIKRSPVEAPMNTFTPQQPGVRSSSPSSAAFSWVAPA